MNRYIYIYIKTCSNLDFSLSRVRVRQHFRVRQHVRTHQHLGEHTHKHVRIRQMRRAHGWLLGIAAMVVWRIRTCWRARARTMRQNALC